MDEFKGMTTDEAKQLYSAWATSLELGYMNAIEGCALSNEARMELEAEADKLRQKMNELEKFIYPNGRWGNKKEEAK